ncbi:acetylcholine receptor subunit alpha-like 1 [Cotesia glomerata]|uniref:Uncharacterized protein n=1 Tax=Cotesia glomerata TaxID=32391 RepID=A0AAV7HZG7_COTGL|nr:acetylcholine receptor subunit alpha-like 1 [Cotesia glomerata]KAH0539576.1 hypothetical protein KQX54_005771 [Cotesia glomerata]
MCRFTINFYRAFVSYFLLIYVNYNITPVHSAYAELWNATWVDRLKRDLLSKYDKFARPAQHFNATRVFFGMTINHISVEEFKSAISVQAWVRMVWTDDKLKWNASNYGGLGRLQAGSHEVWQPDIILYNSIAISSVEHYGDTHCHIYSDGTVIWVPPTHFLALCDLDLRLWPFDTQICQLKLGSWSYSGNQIDLRLNNNSLEGTINLVDNTEWRLVDVTRLRNVTTYECCKDEPYIHLVFTLTIKRNAPLYSSVFLTPAAAIVIMCLVNFWLPAQSKEKLLLCGVNVIVISLFLIYFGYRIPPHSTNSPLLVSFYSGCLYQVTISLVISAIIINLSRRPYSRPLPRHLKKILVGWPGRYLGLSDLIQAIQSEYSAGEQELRESQGVDSSSVYASNLISTCSENGDRENIISSPVNVTQLEWILLATAIDRSSFLIFCNIFILMAISCLS